MRQQVTREYLGHVAGAPTGYGSTAGTCYARERLSDKRFATIWNACLDVGPSADLLATWIAKEELRDLLGCAGTADRREIRQ